LFYRRRGTAQRSNVGRLLEPLPPIIIASTLQSPPKLNQDGNEDDVQCSAILPEKARHGSIKDGEASDTEGRSTELRFAAASLKRCNDDIVGSDCVDVCDVEATDIDTVD